MTDEQFVALMKSWSMAYLEEVLADLFVPASIKEQVKREIASRNAFAGQQP